MLIPGKKGCERCKHLHRLLQKAEGRILKLERELKGRPVDPWAGKGRKVEAVERDKMAEVIEHVGGGGLHAHNASGPMFTCTLCVRKEDER